MTSYRLALLLGAMALAPLSVAAQARTWRVDAANAPGTDFTDLPPAVAAAAHGDTILVSAGRYSGFRTGKALRILGEGTVDVAGAFGVSACTEITGLPAGRTLVMRGLTFQPFYARVGLSLTDNAGRIHLEDVDGRAPSPSTAIQTGIAVTRCAQVTITGGTHVGYPAIVSRDSTVLLTGADVAGGSDCPSGLCAAVTASPGIVLVSGLMIVARTDVDGGSGGLIGPTVMASAPAIRVHGGAMQLTGDATTTIRSGAPFASVPVPIIDGTAGTLYLDPTVTLVGTHLDGPPSIVVERFASLLADGAPPGGNVSLELVSPSGAAWLLAASWPVDALWTTAGPLLVDPLGAVVLAGGVQGPSEHASVSIPVPTTPGLRGTAVAFQSLLLAPSGELRLSTPATVVLDG